MYQFSRAIFLAVKDLVEVDGGPEQRAAAQRRVLAACEGTIERIGADPSYFARPVRSLLEEIRHEFPIRHQARVFVAVDEVIRRVQLAAQSEAERRSSELGRCHALTRKGQPCQRAAMPGSTFCPSHAHLDEHAPAGVYAA